MAQNMVHPTHDPQFFYFGSAKETKKGGSPPVIFHVCWLINPINYRYILNKPIEPSYKML